MARSPRLAKVQLTDVEGMKDAIKAHVTGSTLYVSKLKKLAEKRAGQAAETAAEYYEAAIQNINDEVIQPGVSPATAPRNQINIRSPRNEFTKVTLAWQPLSGRWLKEKARRGKAGWVRQSKFAKKGSKPWKGRSHGPNSFWLDEKKLARYFKGYIGRGDASVTVELKEQQNGDFRVEFVVRLKKLPAGYLDRAIRRSLLQGAVGMGSAGGFLRFQGSEIVTESNPQGLGRGMWPEAMRPTMRPIAQRLGRAMKLQIIKSLNRR